MSDAGFHPVLQMPWSETNMHLLYGSLLRRLQEWRVPLERFVNYVKYFFTEAGAYLRKRLACPVGRESLTVSLANTIQRVNGNCGRRFLIASFVGLRNDVSFWGYRSVIGNTCQQTIPTELSEFTYHSSPLTINSQHLRISPSASKKGNVSIPHDYENT